MRSRPKPDSCEQDAGVDLMYDECEYIYRCFFFFQAEDGIRDLTVTGVQTCALPISGGVVLEDEEAQIEARRARRERERRLEGRPLPRRVEGLSEPRVPRLEQGREDRKSTRLNSSHSQISYAVFCLKKKKKEKKDYQT